MSKSRKAHPGKKPVYVSRMTMRQYGITVPEGMTFDPQPVGIHSLPSEILQMILEAAQEPNVLLVDKRLACTFAAMITSADDQLKGCPFAGMSRILQKFPFLYDGMLMFFGVGPDDDVPYFWDPLAMACEFAKRGPASAVRKTLEGLAEYEEGGDDQHRPSWLTERMCEIAMERTHTARCSIRLKGECPCSAEQRDVPFEQRPAYRYPELLQIVEYSVRRFQKPRPTKGAASSALYTDMKQGSDERMYFAVQNLFVYLLFEGFHGLAASVYAILSRSTFVGAEKADPWMADSALEAYRKGVLGVVGEPLIVEGTILEDVPISTGKNLFPMAVASFTYDGGTFIYDVHNLCPDCSGTMAQIGGGGCNCLLPTGFTHVHVALDPRRRGLLVDHYGSKEPDPGPDRCSC